MSSVSDRQLRVAARAVSWFLAVMLAARVPLAYLNEQTSGDPSFVVVLAFPLVGLLILRQQPRTMGWLLQGVGLVWGVGASAGC